MMKKIKHIATIKEWKNVTIELNLIDWGKGGPLYDIRKWNGDEPLKGISLRKNDLIALYNAIQEELGFGNHFDTDDILSAEVEETDFLFGIPFPEQINEVAANLKREEILDFRNVIVHDDFDSCVKANHEYEEVNAIVSLYTKLGVEEISVSARHCKTCGAYYISQMTYNSLVKKGRILCKVVTKKEYNTFIKNTSFVDLEFQSILAITGYNVNSKDDLSDQCRQEILSRAIEAGIYTKEKALNHISFLIKLNEDKGKMSSAVEKWKRDRDFLQNGESEVAVKVKSIIREV